MCDEMARTYLGGLFVGCCCEWRRDVVGIAHGEESVDRAVLVAAHRVDDRMPISPVQSSTRG